MEKSSTWFARTFSHYFKEIIYGGVDGIVTTFAVVAGFAGASLSGEETMQLSFMIVLLFGLANLFGDAASMGLGNYLSVRSEKDLYMAKRKKEEENLKNNLYDEVAKTTAILQKKGFAAEDADSLASIYKHNKEYWLDFMMHHKEELSDPRGESPVFTGIATFLSFMIFGSIPLLPFLVQESGNASTAFGYSMVGTFTALIILGLLKWRVIGSQLKASLFEVVVIGATAATLAYLVGTFFVL